MYKYIRKCKLHLVFKIKWILDYLVRVYFSNSCVSVKSDLALVCDV